MYDHNRLYFIYRTVQNWMQTIAFDRRIRNKQQHGKRWPSNKYSGLKTPICCNKVILYKYVRFIVYIYEKIAISCANTIEMKLQWLYFCKKQLLVLFKIWYKNNNNKILFPCFFCYIGFVWTFLNVYFVSIDGLRIWPWSLYSRWLF